MKYELAQADLEIAADSLARAMHFLIEQHGLEELPPEQMAELERDVLEWYGLVQPSTPVTQEGRKHSLPSRGPVVPHAHAPVVHHGSAHASIKHARSSPSIHKTPNAHGTAITH